SHFPRPPATPAVRVADGFESIPGLRRTFPRGAAERPPKTHAGMTSPVNRPLPARQRWARLVSRSAEAWTYRLRSAAAGGRAPSAGSSPNKRRPRPPIRAQRPPPASPQALAKSWSESPDTDSAPPQLLHPRPTGRPPAGLVRHRMGLLHPTSHKQLDPMPGQTPGAAEIGSADLPGEAGTNDPGVYEVRSCSGPSTRRAVSTLFLKKNAQQRETCANE